MGYGNSARCGSALWADRHFGRGGRVGRSVRSGAQPSRRQLGPTRFRGSRRQAVCDHRLRLLIPQQLAATPTATRQVRAMWRGWLRSRCGVDPLSGRLVTRTGARMHDPRVLLDPATEAVRKLARRGYELDLGQLDKLLTQRTSAIQRIDNARGEGKQVANQVQAKARAGEDVVELRERARALKTEIQQTEEQHRRFDADLQDFLLGIPNLPDDRLPDGDSDEFAVEVRTWGDTAAFDFEAADHGGIGERLGIFDFPRATKLAGPRFAILKGPGAQLERAIATF